VIIYRLYKDFSDEYYQAFTEYGFYLDEDKAVAALEKIIREEQDEDIDEEQIAKLKDEWSYELNYIGFYGINEIEVIE
jgi:hypothetical protein